MLKNHEINALTEQEAEESRTLPRIGVRIHGSDECHAQRRVPDKDMSVDSFVTATCAIRQRLQLFHQHAAQSHRIHLYQFGERRSYRAQQVITIGLHLSGHVLVSEHRVQPAISGGIDINRKVGTQIIDGIQHQVIGQFVENISNHLLR